MNLNKKQLRKLILSEIKKLDNSVMEQNLLDSPRPSSEQIQTGDIVGEEVIDMIIAPVMMRLFQVDLSQMSPLDRAMMARRIVAHVRRSGAV